MAHVDVSSRERLPDCPFCGEGLAADAQRFACTGCGVAVHEDCAVELRDLACPNLGCGGVLSASSLAADVRVQEARREAVRPAAPARAAARADPKQAGPARRRRAVGLALSALCGVLLWQGGLQLYWVSLSPAQRAELAEEHLRRGQERVAQGLRPGEASARERARKQAKDELEWAVFYAPENADALNSLGFVYDDFVGSPRRALDTWQRALELDPTLSMVHYRVGRLLQEQGDLEGAVASYTAGLEHEPLATELPLTGLMTPRVRMECYVELERWGEAATDAITVGDFERAVELATRAGLLEPGGPLFVDLQRLAAQERPAGPAIRVARARLRAARGDSTGARADLEVAVRARPRLRDTLRDDPDPLVREVVAGAE